MMRRAGTDLTLPSIVAALGGAHAKSDLVLTIIFHADTARIGHKAMVPLRSGDAPWVLGRYSPQFTGTCEQMPAGLDDVYVSRSALQFHYQGKRLMICRFDTASRCRVGSAELHSSVELSRETLFEGIPLMLGHSIVLLLRLTKRGAARHQISAHCASLRGQSDCMETLRQQVARTARSDLDVLIRGETGTGKELIATAIHQSSERASGPMVRVNMAAIPSALAVSALFGSARGAFTGADRTTSGYFEQAEGGSLFLDEIGDVALDVQPLLLRVLEQREIQTVGGPIRRVNVRVIAATDAALAGKDCQLKGALRHRLGACEITLPALHEHPEDMGELLLHFLQCSAAEAKRTELLPHAQSPARDIAAWAILFFRLVRYSWPGNVRELINFAQQIVLASENIPVLNENLQLTLSSKTANAQSAEGSLSRRKIHDIDDETFDQAMVSNGSEASRVALQLGVSRGAVYRRIKRSSRYRLATEISPGELQRELTRHGGDSRIVAKQLQVSVNSLRCHLRNLRLFYT
ncbi:MAG: sigma 54-interacting transcriptional regulator [Halioglobus sp.]|nr:sigma 54-interacting transcriptional regulator [Halioglobus sp.]